MIIKIILFKCFLILLIITSTNYAQDKSIKLPTPQIGWDSLQKKISYLELARRADLWGAYEVKIKIDSTGKLLNQEINIANYELNNCKNSLSKNDSLFFNYIEYEF